MQTRPGIVSVLLAIFGLLISLASAGASPMVARAQSPVSGADLTPATKNELIVNGDFEADAAWEFPATALPASYSTAQAHSGLRSARTGAETSGNNKFSYSSVRQAVTIPADTLEATLTFWLWQWTTELPTKPVAKPPELGARIDASSSSDVQYVLVLDENNNIIGILVWELQNYRGWVRKTFDLLSYKGRTIKLHFGTANDGWGGYSGMYVDDVSLLVKLAPCLPAKPTLLSPANGATVDVTEVPLSWNSALCANKYKVVIREGSKKGETVDSDTVKATNYTTNSLTRGLTYYWRVQAISSVGKTASDWWSFDISE